MNQISFNFVLHDTFSEVAITRKFLVNLSINEYTRAFWMILGKKMSTDFCSRERERDSQNCTCVCGHIYMWIPGQI